MPKVIMTCGKICSGKSTYAQKLRLEYSAVILSVDEITLALFGNEAGEKLDDYVCRAENYLYNKSLEIMLSLTGASGRRASVSLQGIFTIHTA